VFAAFVLGILLHLSLHWGASKAMSRSSNKAHREFFRGTRKMTIHKIAAVGAASVLSCVVAATAQAQVRTSGGMTTLALPSQTSQLGAQADFAKG
jgi:hypothetical protein